MTRTVPSSESRHNPVHCLIPPYIVDRLADSGQEHLRKLGRNVEKVAAMFRNRRLMAPPLPPLLSAAPTPSACVCRHSVYSAGNQEVQPGVIKRRHGEPATQDKAVDEAYAGGEWTWKLLNKVYGRCSIDGRGLEIVQTVHYGNQFQNAFWDGSQMVYGDGDGEVFGSFTADLDIMGHELAYGMTQYEANLDYQGQSGALNEHMSDVFGSLVKQYAKRQTAAKADWLIGANVLIGKDYALRSMKAPGTAYVKHPLIGTDPQPAHMKDYVKLPDWDDHGGVHINSGIPNKAFFLAATALGGHAWEKVGWIWYLALRDLLGRRSTFVKAAKATLSVADDRFGSGSQEKKSVERAWKDVGVL